MVWVTRILRLGWTNILHATRSRTTTGGKRSPPARGTKNAMNKEWVAKTLCGNKSDRIQKKSTGERFTYWHPLLKVSLPIKKQKQNFIFNWKAFAVSKVTTLVNAVFFYCFITPGSSWNLFPLLSLLVMLLKGNKILSKTTTNSTGVLLFANVSSWHPLHLHPNLNHWCDRLW